MNTRAGHRDRESGARSRATGFLVLNKPTGMSSRALVDRVVRIVPGTKVGHAGTLDPLASGLLIVCVGPATKLIEWIQKLPKTYRAGVRLGARSDTCDADGRIEVEPSPRVPETIEVEEALSSFRGYHDQVPPGYSALKVKGRRAYELARSGQQPALAPRKVRIDRIALSGYNWPDLEIEIDCGSGTYIRSIARDLGEMLGCGGYVTTLVRTRIGPFELEQALDSLALSPESFYRHLRPALEAVPDLPRAVLQTHQVEDVAHGGRVNLGELSARPAEGGPAALIGPDGRLVALAEIDIEDGWAQPRKVLI